MEADNVADEQTLVKKNVVIVEKTEPDYAPRPMRPTNLDIFWLGCSVVAHFVDVGTDVNIAYQYYRHEEMLYFWCTIFVTVFPSAVNTCVSFRMYVMDAGNRITVNRCFMLLFQMAPVQRYIDSLRYALKSRKAEKKGNKDDQERYYLLMIQEDADVALLRVFECFLEAAPQQVLQISFLLRGVPNPSEPPSFSIYHQLVVIVISFLGMSWSLLSYQRSIRFAQEDKDNISTVGSVCIFIWHLCVIVSRICVLTALLSLFWKWTLIAVAVHWTTMTVSLSLLETNDFCRSPASEHPRCREQFLNFLFSCVLGLVYIFNYITPGEGGTAFRYGSYYSLCFAENVVGAIIWAKYSDESTHESWYFIPFIVVCVGLFCIGILFMGLYYKKFHPSQYVPPSIIPHRRPKMSSPPVFPSSSHLTTSFSQPEVLLNGSTQNCQETSENSSSTVNGSKTPKAKDSLSEIP